MSHNFKTDLVDIEYFYKRKSKFFKEMKEQSDYGKISINQFLKYLSIAYHINETTDDQSLRSYFSNNFDWTKITRSKLFSELIDMTENSVYDVIRETNNLDSLNINKEVEVFNGCDYFFSIPSGTTLSLSCESLEIVSNANSSVKIDALRNNLMNVKTDKSCDLIRKNSAKRQTVCKPISKEKCINNRLNQLKPLNRQNCSEPNITNKKLEISKRKILCCKQNLSKNIRNANSEKVSVLNQINNENTQIKDKSLNKTEDKPVFVTNTNCSDDDNNNVDKNLQYSQERLEMDLINLIETDTNIFKDLETKKIKFHKNILEWISQWMISNSPLEKRIYLSIPHATTITCPSLDPTTVVSVLACASYFQISPLVDICLQYCKNNMNEILKTSSDLSDILNDDALLTTLSNMFSNVDVEAVKDKSDKIRSYLYTKLIASLSLPEPEPWKGHFSSLAKIFKCKHCQKLVLYKIATTVTCLEKNVQMSLKGKILNVHDQDPDWNLTEYIRDLREELKCWRRVYWRVWAECHFLYCTSCCSHYSVSMYNQCLHHPEQPKFSSQEQGAYIGHYPCCDAKAFKYECIRFPNKGCQMKNHTPLLKNNRASVDTMRVFQLYQPLMFPSSIDLNKNILSPVGAKLSNKREKYKVKNLRKRVIRQNVDKWKELQSEFKRKANSLVGNAIGKTKELLGMMTQTYNCYDGLKLAESDLYEISTRMQNPQLKLSTRFNQDNQRTYEENIMKSVNEMLSRRIKCQNALSDMTNINKVVHSNLSNKFRSFAVKSDTDTCSTVSNTSSEISDNQLSTSSSSLNSSVRIQHSRNTTVWNSYKPLPGNYIRIESEWIDTHNIPPNLLLMPHKFYSQSANSNTLTCSRSDHNIMWNIVYSYLPKNKELQSFPFNDEDNRIWVFNSKYQELDYFSAAYIPIVMKREHKYYTRHAKLDWDSLIELERYWNLFLAQFFEYEATPGKEDSNNAEKKK